MKLVNWLLPREDKFSQSLSMLSGTAHQAALLLREYVENTDATQRAVTGRAIVECKEKAKNLLSGITQSLCQTYMTPFDREDIQEFAVNLYKITKTLEKVRERIDLHGITSENGDFSQQINLIVQEGQAMNEMVAALGKGKADQFIIEKTDILQNLEMQGDDILAKLLVSLFSEDRSARDLILRKDIYDMLEKVVDRYRDAANIAVEIVLKHK